MAKISTLTAMSLVLWLAMSVGIWAEKSWAEWSQRGLGMPQRNEVDKGGGDGKAPTEDEVMAFLNVLHGAEIALQAHKFQTALAMVAGVIARSQATNLPDHKKAAKLKEMLPKIEDAVEKDNKEKAIALIRTIEAEFKKREEKEQGGGGVQKRELLGPEDQKQLQEVVDLLKKSFCAIRAKQKEKAEAALDKLHEAIINNQELRKDTHTSTFLEVVHEARKMVMKDQIEQAGEEIHAAASKIAALEQANISEGEAEAKRAEDAASEPQRRQVIQTVIKQILEALKGGYKDKSEYLLADAYQLFQSDETLNKEETEKMIPVIKVTQKLVKQGAMDKAQQVFQGAANEMAGKARIINRKTYSHGPEL